MYSSKKTLHKVRATISRHEMIQPGDLVVVAVSGGPDSVCLLHILHELRDELHTPLVVAHFDHGLRPDEDESETSFVLGLAESLDLPFDTAKWHLPAKKATGSREEAARNARYTFLESVRRKRGAQKLALGHNLNDQAETMLMRLLRGSGPSGLAGIPPCRDGSIIRPLIGIDRLEIERYLKAKSLSSVTDSSNISTDYLRNRVRLELMPLLERYQPHLTQLLGQTAEIFRDEDRYLERIAQAWVQKEIVRIPDNSYELSINSFLDLPVALRRRATRQIIAMAKKDLRRVNWDHIESIQVLVQAEKPQAFLKFPGGIEVRRTYDRLSFYEKQRKKLQPFSYALDLRGDYKIKEIGRILSMEEIENRRGLHLQGPARTAYLDAEKLHFPLTLRTFKTGDRFIPLGMRGHKKLKDFFVDLKVPMDQRRSTPILCCDDTPVWICGFRIDDRFKITPETKRVLKVSLK